MSTYGKSDLVIELAATAGISRRKTGIVLDKLAEVTYREARANGFTVPGICRVDVICRKARRARNPRTGEVLLIGEHDMVRVRHLKKARDMITPAPPNLVTVLPPEAVAPPAPPVAAPPAPAPSASPPVVPPPPVSPIDQPLMPQAATPAMPPPVVPLPAPAAVEKLISFRCRNPECRQEIEAADDMAGTAAECPACGTALEVPYFSEPGTLHGPVLPPTTTEDGAPTMGRTIRIELPDDDPFAEP